MKGPYETLVIWPGEGANAKYLEQIRGAEVGDLYGPVAWRSFR